LPVFSISINEVVSPVDHKYVSVGNSVAAVTVSGKSSKQST